MRVIGVFVVLVLSAFFTLAVIAAPESCILAERDPDGDVAATPPTPTSVADVLSECACCGNTILPLLPDCSGSVAFAVPAADCPKSCNESTAYVLCQGVCYSDCACELPEGFSLLDGGP